MDTYKIIEVIKEHLNDKTGVEYSACHIIEKMRKIVSEYEAAEQKDSAPGVYDLKLHEACYIKSDDNHPDMWRATRVPGGWIYKNDNPRLSVSECVFIPVPKLSK